MLLSVGNGAPEQVDWTLDFLVMFFDLFLGMFLIF